MTIQTRPQTPEGGTPIVGADPVYLADPLLDATVRMLVELSAQVWVERERRLTLEALLESRGLLGRADIEAFQPSAELTASFEAERARFIEDVFKELRRIPLEAGQRVNR
jgi:hypothetical protein